MKLNPETIATLTDAAFVGALSNRRGAAKGRTAGPPSNALNTGKICQALRCERVEVWRVRQKTDTGENLDGMAATLSYQSG
jgi:hypothetical protein